LNQGQPSVERSFTRLSAEKKDEREKRKKVRGEGGNERGENIHMGTTQAKQENSFGGAGREVIRAGNTILKKQTGGTAGRGGKKKCLLSCERTIR